MTFPFFETSQESGDPLELYEFRLGTDTFDFVTSEDEIFITALGKTFDPEVISRKRVVMSTDNKIDRVTVSVPGDNLFVTKYIDIVPGQRATLTIFRLHRSDVDQDTIVVFKGIVQAVTFKKNNKVAELLVLPLTAASTRTTPRFTYQNLCNHMLYDSRCKIAESAFEFNFTVTAVNGNIVTVPGAAAQGADFFESGFIQFGNDFRLVKAQSGDDLTLSIRFVTDPLTQTVRVQAGCKHRLITDCQDKFANVDNFGGFPFVPRKNPFEGLD